jgi:hypothetical protein
MVLTRTADQQPPVAGGYRDGSGTPGAELVEAAGFAPLAVVLCDAAGMAETVDLVLEYALRANGCDCAGVILVRHGKGLQTAGVTHWRVEHADRLQLQDGEGPRVPVSRAAPQSSEATRRGRPRGGSPSFPPRAQVSVRKEINL